MNKLFIYISLSLLLLFPSCASRIIIPQTPLIISEPPSRNPGGSVSVGLVKLKRPLELGEKYGLSFSNQLAGAIDNGMALGCELSTSRVEIYKTQPNNPDVDILLVPENPFFEIGKGALSVEATISMDVKVIIKGQNKERGFLVEATGEPGQARPKRKVKISNLDYGLIGSKVLGNPAERAINDALFSFSIEFAQKISKLVESYE